MITFPIWFLLVIALALGIGLLAGALMVRYRDVQYILPVGIQFLLFASPVAYTLASVPASAQTLVRAEPAHRPARGHALVAHRHPAAVARAGRLLRWRVALVVLVVGTMVFSRMERQFADVI